jgi:hypothetical protein
LENEEYISNNDANYSQLINFLDPRKSKQQFYVELFDLSWDSQKNDWSEMPGSNSLIKTKEGKEWIKLITGPFFDVSAVLNKMSKNDIHKRGLMLSKTITQTLKFDRNMKKYGIARSDVKSIHRTIVFYCVNNLLRALNGGIDYRLLNQNTKFHEVKNITQTKNDKWYNNFDAGNALK